VAALFACASAKALEAAGITLPGRNIEPVARRCGDEPTRLGRERGA
jgi:hypothetical protein